MEQVERAHDLSYHLRAILLGLEGMEVVLQLQPRRQLVIVDPTEPLVGRDNLCLEPCLEAVNEHGKDLAEAIHEWVWLAN